MVDDKKAEDRPEKRNRFVRSSPEASFFSPGESVSLARSKYTLKREIVNIFLAQGGNRMNKIFVLIAIFAFSVGLVTAQSKGHEFGQQSSSQIELLSGTTSVDLSPGFVGALGSLNIAPGSVFPASLRGARASFPITDGTLDRQTLRGEIVHSGGLTLTRGATQVKLKSFIIDTTGSGVVLTGLVSANGSVVGRIPLFNLQIPEPDASSFRFERVVLNGVVVNLRPEAANALNAVFETNAFVPGFNVGTARVRGFGYFD